MGKSKGANSRDIFFLTYGLSMQRFSPERTFMEFEEGFSH